MCISGLMECKSNLSVIITGTYEISDNPSVTSYWGSVKAHFHALSALQSLTVEGKLAHNSQTSMSLC